MDDEERKRLKDIIAKRDEEYLNTSPPELRPLREEMLALRKGVVRAITRKHWLERELKIQSHYPDSREKNEAVSRLRGELTLAIGRVEEIKAQLIALEAQYRMEIENSD